MDNYINNLHTNDDCKKYKYKSSKDIQNQTNTIVLTMVVCFIILIILLVIFVFLPVYDTKKKVDKVLIPLDEFIVKTGITEKKVDVIVTKITNIEKTIEKFYPGFKSFICPLYPDLPFCK